jgi:hypothetical protein
MTAPPLRLAFAPIFWRIFLVAFTAQQLIAFNKSRHHLRHTGPAEKFAAFLDFTPYALALGLFAAAAAAVALDLLIRFLARPLAARWYAPRGTGAALTPLSFHLGAGESLLAETPARRASGRGYKPGTLVLTDTQLAFYPTEWDLEPWAADRAEIVSLRVEPSRPVLGSFLEGVPGRLLVRARSTPEIALAVPDPAAVLAWFQRPDFSTPTTPPPVLLSHDA